MRNISTKANRGLLSPGEFNSMQDELENIVTNTGGALDAATGPDNDLNMLGQAAATYGSAGDFYEDTSTSGNAYVLNRESSIEEPQSYIPGLRAIFKSTNTNTGAATINVAGLGVKDLKHPNGNALSGSDITSGTYYTAIYNNTDNRFELLP